MPKTKKVAKIWQNCDLPAKLFFDILENGKLVKLVIEGQSEALKTPPTRKLVRAWTGIYDEFFTIKDDPKMKLIFKVKKKVLSLKHRIDLAEQCLYALATTAFTDEQLQDLAKRLMKYHISIDLSKDLREELLRVLKSDLPAIKTDLEVEIGNLEKLTKSEKANFEDNCVAFEGFGYQINEQVSLRKYLAYEKAVITKSKKYKDAGR